MHGRGEKSVLGFGGNAVRKETIQKSEIKMDFREIGWEGMEWIDLAQDRDWWWALVNGDEFFGSGSMELVIHGHLVAESPNTVKV
jgi:hypothetical protein